ncbi:hypothetical protein EZV62_026550 [Acer yangbiense]|uniref:Receptor-like serine/threonine-protein kinase n=1 Tax=Acer yangbiense TaxID=1000413 RepID=A0A5C7GSZ9_9ROSI|nr:hypothetical protein EZV62_026550 [Acer yangbiense]
MELSSSGVLIVLSLLPFCFCSEFVAVDAIDTITASQPLRDTETITSSDSAFKLGFFSPVNSTNRYVGIWYNDKSEAVIWVANRNRPLKDASGVVTISEDGNLVVLNGQKEVLWSSNVSNQVTNASAQVLGSGNLVLNNNTSGSIWESFGQPTDTLMRRMRLSTDTKTDKKDMKVVVIVSVVVGVVAIAICTFFLWWWMAKRKEDQDYLDTLLSSPTLDHPYYWSTKKQLAVMDPRSRSIAVALVLVLSCFHSNLGSALDTITSSQLIRDNETIISSGSAFELGFFSPVNSSNRYVGIWFNDRSETVIWVANRNKPLKDASGVLKISEDGNLVVLNGKNEVLWSSNVSKPLTNATAQLLDSGNLVLVDSTHGISIWESFQDPTHTVLSGMKLSTNKRTGQKVQLTSWKNPSDPSPGSYSHGIESSNIPEAFTWNDSQVYWRTGPWNGEYFIGVNGMVRYTYSNDGFQLLVDTQADAVSFTYSFLNLSMFFSLSSQGKIEGRYWNEGKKNWDVNFQSLQTECDVYGLCGAFGNCNSKKNPICSCLRGFEPKNIEEWNSGNWTSGCVRKRLLQCEKMNQTGDKVENDGFLKLETMKFPVFAARSFATIEKCRELCLNNCSCIAYAYDAGIGCMTWTGSLIDLQKFSIGGADLYIRLAHSELEKKDNNVVVIVPVVAGTITCAICIFFVCKWMTKRKGIWYNKKSDPIVWVANRNKPLSDASGIVTISEDGNLVVLNGQNEVLWLSNVSNSVNNVSAHLLDTGNLVLRDITTGISIWESFQEPTDTFMAGMKLSSHMRTGPIVQLRSWKSPSDPSPEASHLASILQIFLNLSFGMIVAHIGV